MDEKKAHILQIWAWIATVASAIIAGFALLYGPGIISRLWPNQTSSQYIETKSQRQPTPGGEWPSLKTTWQIEITPDLPKRWSGELGGNAFVYDFYQQVTQGDKLQFDVTPVNGADM